MVIRNTMAVLSLLTKDDYVLNSLRLYINQWEINLVRSHSA
jgi:hypothetical protein